MVLSGYADLARRLSGDGDNSRAKPACWQLKSGQRVAGCSTGGQSLIARMLDCEKHGFAFGVEQRPHIWRQREPGRTVLMSRGASPSVSEPAQRTHRHGRSFWRRLPFGRDPQAAIGMAIGAIVAMPNQPSAVVRGGKLAPTSAPRDAAFEQDFPCRLVEAKSPSVSVISMMCPKALLARGLAEFSSTSFGGYCWSACNRPCRLCIGRTSSAGSILVAPEQIAGAGGLQITTSAWLASRCQRQRALVVTQRQSQSTVPSSLKRRP